jgi:hypothetical protein
MVVKENKYSILFYTFLKPPADMQKVLVLSREAIPSWAGECGTAPFFSMSTWT